MIDFIEIFSSSKNNQFYFRGRARNNKIIFQSEGYVSLRNVLRTARPLARQLNVQLECRYVFTLQNNK
jgi:hypothetical protein